MRVKLPAVLLFFAIAATPGAGGSLALERRIADAPIWTPPFCLEDFFAAELHCAPRAELSSAEQYRLLNKVDSRGVEEGKPYTDLFAWPESR
jgi:hypothetical protein